MDGINQSLDHYIERELIVRVANCVYAIDLVYHNAPCSVFICVRYVRVSTAKRTYSVLFETSLSAATY